MSMNILVSTNFIHSVIVLYHMSLKQTLSSQVHSCIRHCPHQRQVPSCRGQTHRALDKPEVLVRKFIRHASWQSFARTATFIQAAESIQVGAAQKRIENKMRRSPFSRHARGGPDKAVKSSYIAAGLARFLDRRRRRHVAVAPFSCLF